MLNLINHVVDNIKTDVEPPRTKFFLFEITELMQVCMDRYCYKSEPPGIELISFIQPDMPDHAGIWEQAYKRSRNSGRD